MRPIRELNNAQRQKEIIVGSADVKALYPSLDIEFTAKIVSEVFYSSCIRIEGINHQELGLYLALNMEPDTLEALGVNSYCPSRKHKRGRPPTITGCAMDNNLIKRYKPWDMPVNTPNDEQERIMLREALKVVILFIMKNHIYTFENQIKMQSDGGPIGLELTGDVAQVFMMWWDEQLRHRLEERGLRVLMYKRYVDDINMAMETPTSTEEHDKSSDVRAMNIVKEIGDSIHPSIKIETDSPSQHDDSKLPILDLKVWVEKRKKRFGNQKY